MAKTSENMNLAEAERAYNKVVEQVDELIAEKKALKRVIDGHLEAQRLGAILGVDVAALPKEERDQLLSLMAKAGRGEGDAVVAVDVIKQDNKAQS